MILQKLYELYQTKSQDGAGDLPILGWQWQSIPYVLLLSEEGDLIDIAVSGDEKLRNANRYLVPQGEKRTSGISADILWGNVSYIVGHKPDKPDRGLKSKQAFGDKIIAVFGDSPDDIGLKAVMQFLQNNPLEQVQAFETIWEKLQNSSAMLSFRLDGDFNLICRRPFVIDKVQAFQTLQNANNPQAQCLITGEVRPIERVHPPLKGIKNAQSSGANIICFNEEAFASYRKKQGQNAPVCVEAADAYTKALNWMLEKGSSHSLTLADTTLVFWSKETSIFSEVVNGILGSPSVMAVQALYKGVWRGKRIDETDPTVFYVLGLSANSSRVIVRFWEEQTIGQLSQTLRKYFQEIELDVHDRKGFPPLKILMKALCKDAPNKPIDEVLKQLPPKTEEDFLKAIFGKALYPSSILNLLLTRIKAEQTITPERASLLKAYLNRNHQENYAVSLDKTNVQKAYLLGRLFAVLEDVQEKSGGADTLRERYYTGASTRPQTIYPLLMNLYFHHLDKLSKTKKGLAINREKLVSEILGLLGSDFPKVMTPKNQGRFALGYYQQREDFFTPKTSD